MNVIIVHHIIRRIIVQKMKEHVHRKDMKLKKGKRAYRMDTDVHQKLIRIHQIHGVYMMHGNVYEWCQNWYEEHYPTSPVVDPKGPKKVLSACCVVGPVTATPVTAAQLTAAGMRINLV